MTLRERVKDLRQRYQVDIAFGTLRQYYVRRAVKYRTVDVPSVNKIRR